MNTYRALQQERNGLMREANELLRKAEISGLTDEEKRRDDEIADRMGILNAKIAVCEDQRERELDGAGKFAGNSDGWTTGDLFNHASGHGGRSYAGPARSGRSYREMFPQANVPTHGLKSFDDLALQLFRARTSGIGSDALQMLSAAVIGNGASEGLDSAGGAYVPTEFLTGIIDMALESEIVRPRARIVPMTTDSALTPGFDASDHSSGNIAGLSGVWTPEGGSAAYEVPKVFMMSLKAKKLFSLVAVTDELWNDSGAFQSEVQRRMAQAVAFNLDSAFLTGNGGGEPLGLLNDPAKVTVAKESGQASATIIFDNCAKMLARLHPACFNNAVWLANPSTLPQLLGLYVNIGTVTNGLGAFGAAQPIMPDGRGGYTLFSRPVVFTEKVPALGTEGDLILADLTQYAVGMRQDFRLDMSMHVLFQSDQLAIRLVGRLDGLGTWRTAVTPLKGTDTLSWVVTLASR